jgi:DNA-binding NarL/FixJ family response regulator
MKQIRVLVVDDHSLFRQGLVSLLGEMPRILVVGEAENGRQALSVTRQIQPDVILMDVNMPIMDGVLAVEALRKENFHGQIIMLTVSKHDDHLKGAIIAGADGYLLKNVEPAELHNAILQVTEGKGILSPDITKQVFRAVSAEPAPVEGGSLSSRERQVLVCIAEGNTTAQISDQLSISESTVKTHVRHILKKLDAGNRTEAVRKALSLGLITDHM